MLGGLAGWFTTLTQDGAINVGMTGAQFFLGLGIVLPVAIVVTARLLTIPQERRVLIASAIFGSVLGMIIYVAMIALINGSIGGEDLNAVRTELTNQIPIWQYIVVFGVNLVVSIIVPRTPDEPAP